MIKLLRLTRGREIGRQFFILHEISKVNTTGAVWSF